MSWLDSRILAEGAGWKVPSDFVKEMTGYVLRLSRPLSRCLRDEEIPRLFAVIDHKRDRAIFMLMLRCGLRVEKVAQLTLGALDLPRSQVFVYRGISGAVFDCCAIERTSPNCRGLVVFSPVL